MGPQQLPGGYTLCVDWVQGDPFASPSRLRCGDGCCIVRCNGLPPLLLSCWVALAVAAAAALFSACVPKLGCWVAAGTPAHARRVIVPAAVAGLPAALTASRIRRTAVCDFLTRSFGAAVAASGGCICRCIAHLPCCLPCCLHARSRILPPPPPHRCSLPCPALPPRAGGDIRRQSGGWQGEKGGEMSVDRPGVLTCTVCVCLVHA